MKIWYLDHSGFAVETDQHILVFDYFTDAPKNGALEDGVVTIEKLPPNKRLAVFASHSHFDHYNKVVLDWKKIRPDSLVFLADDIAYEPETIRVSPSDHLHIDGIEVYALKSTDEGVAFLVTVDGKTLYHAGDLNWWHWEGEDAQWLEQMEQDYKTEIGKLQGSQIDVAFLPVDPRLENSAFWGAHYFMTTVGARFMIPMHLWENYGICTAFVEDNGSKSFADRVACINHRGQFWTT